MGETWGISGPRFAVLYAGLMAGCLLLAWGFRRFAGRGTVLRLEGCDPLLAAYLTGGPSRVLQSILVRLRLLGLAEPTAQRFVWRPVTAASPIRLDAPALAVLQAVTARTLTPFLARNPAVRAMLGEVHARAVAAGALLADDVRRRMRLVALFPLAVGALGLVRLAAGVAAHRPVGILELELLVVGVAGAMLLVPPRVHPRLQSALDALRADRETASARLHPVDGAALAVALLGAEAFAAEGGRGVVDPQLVSALEGTRYVRLGFGSMWFAGMDGRRGGGDSGSSGDSGGSSCGSGCGGCGG